MTHVTQREPSDGWEWVDTTRPQRHEAVVRLVCGHCRRGLGRVFGTVDGGIRHISCGPNEGTMPYTRIDLAAGYRPPTNYTPTLRQVLDWTAHRKVFRCHRQCPGSGSHPALMDKLDAAFRAAASRPRRRDRVIVLPDDLRAAAA